jgi:hypothetical protein
MPGETILNSYYGLHNINKLDHQALEHGSYFFLIALAAIGLNTFKCCFQIQTFVAKTR